MLRLFAFALQGAAVTMGSGGDFDLKNLKPAPRPCGGSADGEIVVCGSAGPDHHRLKPLPADRFEPKPFIAETGIAKGVTGAVVVESAPLAGGAVSRRALLRLKTRF